MTNHADTSSRSCLDDLLDADALEPVDPHVRSHDLRAALQLAASDAMAILGVQVDARYDGTALLPSGTVAIVEDLARETLDNVARHSLSNEASLDVSVDDELWLRVRDHGTGFDMTTTRPDDPDGVSRFASSARTVRAAGGSIAVMSAPYKGTIVRVRLPLHDQEPVSG